MNTQFVRIATEDDGTYEVHFTKDVQVNEKKHSRKLVKFGYIFWQIVFIYVLYCSIVYFFTLHKQNEGYNVTVGLSMSVYYLSFVFIPLLPIDYWNYMLKSIHVTYFVIIIFFLSLWRLYAVRAIYRKALALDHLVSCYREYDLGDYFRAKLFLNKYKDLVGFTGQELWGNLAYLNAKLGETSEAEKAIISIYDIDTAIKAKNIRIVVE